MIGLGLPQRTMLKRAFIVSPFSGDVPRNKAYARRVGNYAFSIGFAPYIGHLYLTEILDDTDPKERAFGMDAAYTFMRVCDEIIAGIDLGASSGMKADLGVAINLEKPIRYISIFGFQPTSELIHNLDLPHGHLPCAQCNP